MTRNRLDWLRPLALMAAMCCVTPWAAVAEAPPSDDSCPTIPPHGYVVEVGYGHGNEAKATSEARDRAMQQVIDKVCAGLSEARCNGIRRRISPWEDGKYDPNRRTACAAVAFPQDKLDEQQREAEVLDQEVAALAARVGSMEVGLLRHEAPVWESNCAGGVVGDYLRTAFDGALGGSSVRLDRGERVHPTSSRFHMVLAPGPEKVAVTGYLQRPGEPGWSTLKGPKFALDLFGVEAAEQGRCAADEQLGLRDGQRIGDAGLTVWIELPGGDNLYCEGEEIAPAIRVSVPSRIQIYSVQRNGTAHLVWPMEGDGIIEDEMVLGGGVLLSDEGAGDERLVAVALPAGSSFGPTDRWRGYCGASDDFGDSFYPSGAAVGTATYTVRPQGGGCPAVDVSRFRDASVTAEACGR